MSTKPTIYINVWRGLAVGVYTDEDIEAIVIDEDGGSASPIEVFPLSAIGQDLADILNKSSSNDEEEEVDEYE